jgi:uncharacterized protein YbjT (DUF2867 family)
MKLVVFGATGGIGRELVKQGLGHGHEVRAFARDPAQVKTVHPRLEVVRGDVSEPATVTAAVEGVDAVLSALGTPARHAATVVSDGAREVVEAMRHHGVQRLVLVSALGVGDSKGQLGPLYERVLIPLLLKEVFADKERAEETVRASGLDWTIVRPAVLRNGRLTGHYRAGAAARGFTLFPRIRRADVADFMLAAVERGFALRETPALRY